METRETVEIPNAGLKAVETDSSNLQTLPKRDEDGEGGSGVEK